MTTQTQKLSAFPNVSKRLKRKKVKKFSRPQEDSNPGTAAIVSPTVHVRHQRLRNASGRPRS